MCRDTPRAHWFQLKTQTPDKCRFRSSFAPPRIPGIRGTKEKTSVPPGRPGVGGKNQGGSNPNRQAADGYYI